MANEKIIFDTEVKVGSSVGSVKSLKAELRAVTNELGKLEEGSAAFVAAAQRAGQLRDKIGDVKDTINAFNPEKKFQAIADSVGIAANGFAAMQGAMALFGSESEDLNKVMVKTQGAIALATGLNGLLGMGDALKNLRLTTYSAISGLSGMVTGVGGLSGALNALKTTLLTNPLFVLAAVIIAIGTALKGFYDGLSSGVEIYKSSAKAVADLKKSYTSLIDEIKTLQIENDLANGKITQKDADLLKQKNNFKKDYLKILDDANTKESEIREQAVKERDDDGFKGTKNLLDKLGIETATTKAAKQSLESIEKQKQENIAALKKKYSLINTNIIIEDTKNEIKDNITKNEKIKAEALKLVNQKKANLTSELDVLKAIGTRTVGELEAQQAIQKKVLDIDLKNKLISNEQYNEGLKKLEIEKAKFIKEREKGTNASIKEAALEKQQNINETNQAIEKDEFESTEARFKALDALYKQGLITDTERADAKIAIEKEKAKKQIEIEKSVAEAKKQIQDATLNSAQSVISILQSVNGQSKEIQAAALIGESAIGIAKMVIANNAANIAALATPQAIATSGLSAIPVITMNNISTALGVAANIAATAKGLGALGKGGAPTGNVTPASIPRIPQSISGTILTQNKPLDMNNVSNPTGKVIVVETDITNTQNKVKNIIRKATIK